MREISKFPNGTYLKVEWENGQLVLGGKIDTIYESNNGLAEEDDEYLEYYACAFRIEDVFKNLKDTIYNAEELIEISIGNSPTLITLYDGSFVWSK